MWFGQKQLTMLPDSLKWIKPGSKYTVPNHVQYYTEY